MSELPRKLTDKELREVRRNGRIPFAEAVKRLAFLEALLGEVAACSTPWIKGKPGESDHCFFCKGYDHQASCVWARLRAAVEG